MTLKEKLETKVSIDTTKEAKAFAKECEKIADDYAIEFAEWLICMKDFKTGIYLIKTSKELLEIFKKEKGL